MFFSSCWPYFHKGFSSKCTSSIFRRLLRRKIRSSPVKYPDRCLTNSFWRYAPAPLIFCQRILNYLSKKQTFNCVEQPWLCHSSDTRKDAHLDESTPCQGYLVHVPGTVTVLNGIPKRLQHIPSTQVHLVRRSRKFPIILVKQEKLPCVGIEHCLCRGIAKPGIIFLSQWRISMAASMVL